MSLLGRYLEWFRDQDSSMQIGSTIALFAVLFAFGVYTAGIGPALVIGIVMIDHWYRG